MTEKQSNDEKYLAAQERVKEIKSFYYTLVVYVLINILLIIINLLTSPRDLWFFWITLVWGVVLISQAFKIFMFKGRFLGKTWEERKIKEIMQEESPEKGSEKNLDSKD